MYYEHQVFQQKNEMDIKNKLFFVLITKRNVRKINYYLIYFWQVVKKLSGLC